MLQAEGGPEETLRFGTLVWSAGLQQVKFVQNLNLRGIELLKSRTGRLCTDEYMRVLYEEEVRVRVRVRVSPNPNPNPKPNPNPNPNQDADEQPEPPLEDVEAHAQWARDQARARVRVGVRLTYSRLG